MIGALFFSVFMALCGQVQDLNPTGPVYDMLEWTTPPAEFRATSHMTGKHPMYTVVGQDRIWTIKGDSGDPWDVNLYDETGIYAWITENRWGDSRSFTRWMNMRQVMAAPRYAHGGYPGARWVNCDTRYTPILDCSTVVGVQGLGASIVHELWGPYTVQTYGNIGTVEVLKVVYFYGCSGATGDTCTSAEVNWFSNKYGLIRWANYAGDGSGAWTLHDLSEFFDVVPGTVKPNFPCDLEAK